MKTKAFDYASLFATTFFIFLVSGITTKEFGQVGVGVKAPGKAEILFDGKLRY